MTRRNSVRAISIGGLSVAPGTRARASIPVARLFTGEQLSFSVEVLRGVEPGPTVWLSGALHGDELDGTEIIRRVVGKLDPAKLGGTILAVPVVNVFGLLLESRYLPDRRDLNRSFPGSHRGSLAARIAHLFMKEIVAHCDYGVDLHCGSDQRENLPQVRGNLDDEETLELARAFAAPVTIHGRPPDGSLRKAAVRNGAKVILYEAGEAGRYTERAIQVGTAGTLRTLKALGMIHDAPAAPGETILVRSTHWVRASRSGICQLPVELGARVRKGGRLGTISELLGADPVPVKARRSGIVVGRKVGPLVYQGEALIHLAEPEPDIDSPA